METLARSAAPAATAFAVTSILSTVSLVLMFSGAGVFGPINDGLSVVQFLLLVPVALAFHRLLPAGGLPLPSLATGVGILAMLTFAVLQSLLVVGLVRFEQTLGPVLATGAVIGLWFVVINALLLRSLSLPGWLPWAGIVAGLSFILTAVGWFFLGGIQHPLVAVGFLIGAVLLPVWGFAMGRALPAALALAGA